MVTGGHAAGAHRAPHPHRGPADWLWAFLAADPGLTRLRTAVLAVLSIAAAIGTEYVFVHGVQPTWIQTHGAHLPAAQQALVDAQHHAVLIIGILLGAVVCMLASLGIFDASLRGQLGSIALMPIPMAVGLAVGLALSTHKFWALFSLAASLGIGTYLRRFGPRGFLLGTLLFFGDFFGYFTGAAFGIGDLGWLVAFVAVGLATTAVIRVLLFRPRPAAELHRVQRSFEARARRTIGLAIAVLETRGDRRRVERRLRRAGQALNEAALLIDAQLADPRSGGAGWSGAALHEHLFDLERGVANIGRLAARLAAADLPPTLRDAAVRPLVALVTGDLPGAQEAAVDLRARVAAAEAAGTLERGETGLFLDLLADAAGDVGAAGNDWERAARHVGDGDVLPFASTVMLFGPYLPGSSGASVETSTSTGLRARLGWRPPTYTAVQIFLAVGVAAALGDVVSPRRFYWAVLAAFLAFFGANTSGEQIQKAGRRVAGTVVGIFLGTFFARAIHGNDAGTIVVVLAALFFGIYLIRVNYFFLVVAITVMVSQLYVQLDEFSFHLLLLRLAETALGAVVASLVASFVFPLRTTRVVATAARQEVEALAEALRRTAVVLCEQCPPGTAPDVTLRQQVRSVDNARQALIAAAIPLRRTILSGTDRQVRGVVAAGEGIAAHLRNVASLMDSADRLTERERRLTARAAEIVAESATALGHRLAGDRSIELTRAMGITDRVRTSLEERGVTRTAPERTLVRMMRRLDGDLADLAGFLDVPVHETPAPAETRRETPAAA